MPMRFVTRKIHAYLDYPLALSLVALPFVLGLGASAPVAKWLAVATGIAALVLNLLTNHETGVLKVVPFWFHLDVDRLVGVAFVAAPFVLGFSGLDAIYYWVNGIAVLIVTTLLNAPEREYVPG
jgi:hypothetical protein